MRRWQTFFLGYLRCQAGGGLLNGNQQRLGVSLSAHTPTLRLFVPLICFLQPVPAAGDSIATLAICTKPRQMVSCS